jgi:hypothetical protein
MTVNMDTTPISLPDGIHLHKGPNKLERGLIILDKEIGEKSALHKVIKVARDGLKVTNAILNPFEKGLTAISYLHFFAKLFSAVSIVASAKAFVDQVRRKMPENPEDVEFSKRDRVLQLASAVAGVALGAIASLQLMDILGALKIASITKSLGSIPLIGALVPPLTPVMGALEILAAGLSISIAANKLHNLHQHMGHVKDKRKEWRQGATKELAEKRIVHLRDKQDADLKNATAFQGKRERTMTKVFERIRKYEQRDKQVAEAKGLSRVGAKMDRFIAKQQLLRVARSDEKIREKLEKVKIHSLKVEERGQRWTKIKERLEEGNLSSVEKQQLKQMQTDKLSKWNIKRININWDRVKEVGNIMLSSALAVAMVGSLILFFTGIGAPVAMITMASAFLLLSTCSLGFYFFKKYKKPKPTTSIGIANLRQPRHRYAQSAAIQSAT